MRRIERPLPIPHEYWAVVQILLICILQFVSSRSQNRHSTPNIIPARLRSRSVKYFHQPQGGKSGMIEPTRGKEYLNFLQQIRGLDDIEKKKVAKWLRKPDVVLAILKGLTWEELKPIFERDSETPMTDRELSEAIDAIKNKSA